MNLDDLKSKKYLLPALALGAGLLGVLLRLWLYGTGLEENNLLRASHPAGSLVLLLSLVFAGAAAFLTRPLREVLPYDRRFPRSVPGALGSWIGAAGILMSALVDLVRRENGLNTAAGILGVLAAAGLIWAGLLRLQGKRPGAGPHAAVCLYFVLRLISRYRGWSADPQLQDYAFQLLATVCLMLYSYHRSALDLRDGSAWAVNLLAMLSIYCCCLAAVRSDDKWLYLCTGAWVLCSALPAFSPAPAAASVTPPEVEAEEVETPEEAEEAEEAEETDDADADREDGPEDEE